MLLNYINLLSHCFMEQLRILLNPEVAQKSSDRGVRASEKGAKMTKICNFCTLLCQICSDNNPKLPPIGGLDASDAGAIAPPPSPSLAPPLVNQ